MKLTLVNPDLQLMRRKWPRHRLKCVAFFPGERLTKSESERDKSGEISLLRIPMKECKVMLVASFVAVATNRN